MNEKTLEVLCEKLGTTVEYLLPKAQAYGIWTSVVIMLICCLVIASTIWYLLHLGKKYGDELERGIKDYEFAIGFAGGVFSIIALFAFLDTSTDLIMWITAPELGLLKLIK